MIHSFACKQTEKFFHGEHVRKFGAEMARVATRKLVRLHGTVILETLKIPPGNRLEALSGNRKGQHSIRINDQWRICFRWENGGAYDVEIIDYH